MDACSTVIATTALTLSALVAQSDAATVTLDLPEWMKGSLFLVITALLIWLIIQGWGRYDKLLARIDRTDEKRLEVEIERLKVERERNVTDERQTIQITTLARVIERLEGAIIENTHSVHRCPLEKEHHT